MQTGSDSIELLTALTERDLRFRSDAKVTEHAIAPVDTALLDAYAAIDRKALRHYRLERIREQLRAQDYAGILLADPINIRYATDTNNLGLWVMHSPSRYVFVATDGPVVLFEFTSSRHNSEHVETIDEIRPAIPWLYFLAGPRLQEKAERWAQEVADLMARHGGGNRRLAVDRCDPWGAQRLTQQGIELFDAQPLMEQARLIKSAEEVASHRVSMGVCDLAIARMRTSLVPGVTENQLWSIMHGTNVAHGGEWAESRLLSSGPRTNPWFQDATDKVIKAGEMVCFDTDMVGPGGYLSDISRSFICPGKAPTMAQRDLLDIASQQINHNVELLRPGLSFREFAEHCWPVPKRFEHNRYMMMLHGVGLVDEYPSVAYAVDFAEWGYDGLFQENMVVSVESYIGEQGGGEGVKLEEQVLISANGPIKLSRTPLVDGDR
ncbi:Xaa-Pro peptidase family protein [Pseudomonas sp. GD03651]|jgi:Xaa-Pro aminopeptidase|uniref:M24 family metallopeptidase n=1 Tax=Pseudomonas TaxID=286 RepID=UPI00034EEA85|nr:MULTISPECIES: Xaa-Pro peptidase family protein [Pseudomonas]AGN83373.1 peptidase M24 [Pseudomonas putida H8234]MDH2183766.1 Xaa-Pro peptidase family protein [Pseudomonas sp. GD03651]HDS1814674.1 aminopeptidase P family protein [Pseudomonas putida]HDS3811397.1 aminopeptidase P family protein [Pseudomonas putida]